jgi:hypothetical protein
MAWDTKDYLEDETVCLGNASNNEYSLMSNYPKPLEFDTSSLEVTQRPCLHAAYMK